MPTLTERTLILGHRGACGALSGMPGAYAPENTMPSFELAAQMHADGVETDVHFSKDGKIMILHDAKLDRTTNGQGLITDYTAEELSVFDAGIKTGAEFKKTRIPRLDDLLDLCRRTGMLLNIEIKSADPLMPAALFECVRAHRMDEGVIYSSFDHEQLARMLRVDPSAFVAPLYSFNMIKPWDYAANIPAKAVHPRSPQILLYEGYVDRCHELGIRVHPWDIEDPERAKMFAKLGVDAIITNHPDVMLEALKDVKQS
ncbi:MAG: hypothetical protein IJU46_06220 [Clostridia bacterium]|nr:hypothetical protein [Clostridia bacterium]